MKIAAIARNPENSPNMAENDLAILKGVALLLEQRNHEVELIEEKDFSADKDYEAIVHMTRDASVLKLLAKAEQKGIKVYNSTAGVANCSRKAFTEKLQQHGIYQPEYTIITSSEDAPLTKYPMWFKKSTGWACHPGDVCYADNRQKAVQTIESFARRGIDEILCSTHIAGDVVKFYGVNGGFFHYCYPDPRKTKFSLEKFNGEKVGYQFDTHLLRKTAFDVAEILGIDIFGGDCIITPQGNIVLIDINDFPSFSTCRDEAAAAITELILSETTKR